MMIKKYLQSVSEALDSHAESLREGARGRIYVEPLALAKQLSALTGVPVEGIYETIKENSDENNG